MSALPSTSERLFLIAPVVICPVTHTGANIPLISTGFSGLTCTIWFGGGGRRRSMDAGADPGHQQEFADLFAGKLQRQQIAGHAHDLPVQQRIDRAAALDDLFALRQQSVHVDAHLFELANERRLAFDFRLREVLVAARLAVADRRDIADPGELLLGKFEERIVECCGLRDQVRPHHLAGFIGKDGHRQQRADQERQTAQSCDHICIAFSFRV